MKKHINILIVHYNTPKLTKYLVKSIDKYVGLNCTIYIFDNSDRFPFTYKQDNIKIFDNTKGQIVNFDLEYSKYPQRFKSNDWSHKGISFRHCISIEKCIELIGDNFILMDSDVLLKKDISGLYDNKYTFIASTEKLGAIWHTRVVPYLCFINVKYLQKTGKHYFNPEKMHGLHPGNTSDDMYDTGAWLFETLSKTKFKVIDIDEYIVHYKAASWLKILEKHSNESKKSQNQWLLDNKQYYTQDNEKLIVTLTSWKKRIKNIPVVLTTILQQTKKPDKIVLNLSIDEFPNKDKSLSTDVLKFLKDNSDIIEINWIDGENKKQWKKMLPTLKLYPNDAIVCIDDDFLYPDDMLDVLWRAHLKYPLNPISGNSFKLHGIQCQCGCASLTKLDFLDNVFEYATDEIQKMHSDDVFFTYVAAKAGNPYMYCGKEYFLNMKTYGEVGALSNNSSAFDSLNVMWNYLVKHYGEISLTSDYENFSFSAKPIKRTITTQTTNAWPSRCKCRVASYGIGSLKTYGQKIETFLIEHMAARDTNVKHNKVVKKRRIV